MTSRGITNNNPFDLRYSPEIRWQGLDNPPSDDAGFCRFVDMLHGLRAGFRDLFVAVERHNCHTIRALVSRFAPSTENDTDAYIANVATWTGWGADEPLPPMSISANLTRLGSAFLREEQGNITVDPPTLNAAVASALGA